VSVRELRNRISEILRVGDRLRVTRNRRPVADPRRQEGMRWAELSEVLGSVQADAELAKDLSATEDVSAAHGVGAVSPPKGVAPGARCRPHPWRGPCTDPSRARSTPIPLDEHRGPKTRHLRRVPDRLASSAVRPPVGTACYPPRDRAVERSAPLPLSGSRSRPRYIRVEHEGTPYRSGGHGDLSDTAFPHDLSRNGTLPALTPQRRAYPWCLWIASPPILVRLH